MPSKIPSSCCGKNDGVVNIHDGRAYCSKCFKRQPEHDDQHLKDHELGQRRQQFTLEAALRKRRRMENMSKGKPDKKV